MHGEGHSDVIQHVCLKEHKSVEMQGVWTDVKTSIHDMLQTVPFILGSTCGKEPVDIHVEDLKSASCLMDDLTSTHDVFTPAESEGFLSRTIDRLSGDVGLEYQETEKMLLTNTFLLGIGENTMQNKAATTYSMNKTLVEKVNSTVDRCLPYACVEGEGTTTYPLNKTLVEKVKSSDDRCLPYACVAGEVLPLGRVLHSKHGEGHSGVIQHVGLKEHKSVKVQGVWTDVKKSIHDILQTVPFILGSTCGKEPVDIHVEDPKSASFLMDELTSTHDVFTPADGGGFLSRTLDRLTGGDVVQGYHETEEMLLTKTSLLGIGEIRYVDGKLVLKPPINGSRFILTTKSKAEVIKSLESKSFWIKVFAVGTGVVGISIFCHILYKKYKKNQVDRARERTLAEMRELRQRAVAEREERGGEGDEDSDMCVVCLTNSREIVLLNCGHICLCVDCVSELPEPLTCPVCRQPVERYITTYRP